MKTPTQLRRELAQLDSRYSAAYAKADAQLRNRPFTLAMLYAKDVLNIATLSFSSAVIGVPVMWFWGEVSRMSATQQALALPANDAATWSMMTSLFWTFFIITAGAALLTGRLGRARMNRTHADAQLFFVPADLEVFLTEYEPTRFQAKGDSV